MILLLGAAAFFGGMFIAWRVQRRSDPYVAAARARRAARREQRSHSAPTEAENSTPSDSDDELDGGRFRGLDRRALLDHVPEPLDLGRRTLIELGWTPAQVVLFDARLTLGNDEHNPLNIAVPAFRAVVEDVLGMSWELTGGGDPAGLIAVMHGRGARQAFTMLLDRAAGTGRDPDEFGALVLDALDGPLEQVTNALRGYAPALQQKREFVAPPGRNPALSSRMPDLIVLAHHQASDAGTSPGQLAHEVTAIARGEATRGPLTEALRCYGGVYDQVFSSALDHYGADRRRLRPVRGQNDAVEAFDVILDAAVHRGEPADRAAELLLTTLTDRSTAAAHWISDRVRRAS